MRIENLTPENADTFIKIAADNKCPLAITADTLENLADMANSAKEKGVADLVLSFDGKDTANTIRNITTGILSHGN